MCCLCYTSGKQQPNGQHNIRKALEHEHITGYNLLSLNFQGWYDKKGNPIDIEAGNLKEIVVTGKCGFLRHKDGRLIKKCDSCNSIDYEDSQNAYGISVNTNEWDGSHMFYFRNWEGNIIVTKEVKDIIEKGNYKNIQFIKIEDFRFSD